MVKHPFFAAVFVTVYLIVYCVFALSPATQKYIAVMFLASPLLVIWMVFAVIKYGTYNGRSLDGDEFGYGDKSNSDLGTF